IAPSITATTAGRAESIFTPDELGPARGSGAVDHQTVELVREVADLPLLFIREELPAAVGTPLVVPVELDRKGQPIAALAFSFDIDPTCLSFDPTDGDGDGVPDSVTFRVPADFAPQVFVDLADADGELDFTLADVPPDAVVPDGVIVEITFGVICAPPPEIVPLPFSQAPAASFGDTSGASVPGRSTDGSIRILDGLRGDCNSDGIVDAGDFSACGLEVFDGDGDFWLDVPGGSFVGDPIGCDANADSVVDAGDVACKRRIVFSMPCAEQAAGSGIPLLELPQELEVKGGVASAELTLSPADRQLTAAVLTLEIDPLQIDASSLVTTPIPGVSATSFDVGPASVALILQSGSVLPAGP
ncbi:MAG: hypothetical protein MI919_07870, partial [Holophagales bacterium]|nr:hypothetical protein [Holophagales bacterium]